ncbi:MAG TPA: hypothetical protein VKM55_14335 [Candidatus Lokiarchaeia archaeon]|nr:hypothetical protein [Candidatus Lokiarchaeia archaeon]
MVMAVTKQEEPAIKVDDARKFRINAGQCDKCGYFKSWDFKITNPKTGKQIPGHVTKEGFKINDGDCPFYALLKVKGETKDTDDNTPTQSPVETRPRSIEGTRSHAPAAVTNLGFSASGESIIATIDTCSVSLSKQDAIKACRDLLSLVCG